MAAPTSQAAQYLAQIGRQAQQGPINLTGTGAGQPARTQPANPFNVQTPKRFGQATGLQSPTETARRGVNFFNENNGKLPDAPLPGGSPSSPSNAMRDAFGFMDKLPGQPTAPSLPDAPDPLGLGSMFGEGGPAGLFRQIIEMLFGAGALGGGGASRPNSSGLPGAGPMRFGDATDVGGHGPGSGPGPGVGGHGPADVRAPGLTGRDFGQPNGPRFPGMEFSGQNPVMRLQTLRGMPGMTLGRRL